MGFNNLSLLQLEKWTEWQVKYLADRPLHICVPVHLFDASHPCKLTWVLHKVLILKGYSAHLRTCETAQCGHMQINKHRLPYQLMSKDANKQKQLVLQNKNIFVMYFFQWDRVMSPKKLTFTAFFNLSISQYYSMFFHPSE